MFLFNWFSCFSWAPRASVCIGGSTRLRKSCRATLQPPCCCSPGIVERFGLEGTFDDLLQSWGWTEVWDGTSQRCPRCIASSIENLHLLHPSLSRSLLLPYLSPCAPLSFLSKLIQRSSSFSSSLLYHLISHMLILVQEQNLLLSPSLTDFLLHPIFSRWPFCWCSPKCAQGAQRAAWGAAGENIINSF